MSDMSGVSCELLERQLQDGLAALTEQIGIIGSTDSASAVHRASSLVEEIEIALQRYHVVADTEETQWLATEIHALLAQAKLVLDGRKGWRSEGNVVSVNFHQSDLTDAEFERLLAASDVRDGFICTASDSHISDADSAPATPALRLVYSRDD